MAQGNGFQFILCFPFHSSTQPVRYRTLNSSTIGGFRYGRRIWDCLVVISTRNLLRRFTFTASRISSYKCSKEIASDWIRDEFASQLIRG